MKLQQQVEGLHLLGEYLKAYLDSSEKQSDESFAPLFQVIEKSYQENSWFTVESQHHALGQWAGLLEKDQIEAWLEPYRFNKDKKTIGLILAGNIPLVGFHDLISVVLSGNLAKVKLSSKDRLMLPFLVEKWNEFSSGAVACEWVEKLEGFDAVIATGSNNTARYLEYYFKQYPSIIRKNRTSIAVLSGEESNEQIQELSKDIFTYFGLGCRNVTYLLLPKDFSLDRLFENFLTHKEIINHNSYANNYDYNKAIYLLNQDLFWDNNFVMLKEDPKLFSPLSVVHFSRYNDQKELESFLSEHEQDIQCVVSQKELQVPTVCFGEAQNPQLDQYADHVDTLKFLQELN